MKEVVSCCSAGSSVVLTWALDLLGLLLRSLVDVEAEGKPMIWKHLSFRCVQAQYRALSLRQLNFPIMAHRFKWT